MGSRTFSKWWSYKTKNTFVSSLLSSSISHFRGTNLDFRGFLLLFSAILTLYIGLHLQETVRKSRNKLARAIIHIKQRYNHYRCFSMDTTIQKFQKSLMSNAYCFYLFLSNEFVIYEWCRLILL